MAEADRSETADPEAHWCYLAERAIGAGIETLRSRSAEGLGIEAVCPRLGFDPGQPWRSKGAWSVAQRVDHPEAEAANRLALLDLEGGADALVLVTAESPYARGFGLALENDDLGIALERIELDFISLRLDAGAGTEAALSALTDVIDERRLTSAALFVDIGFDPVGLRERRGREVAADPRPILDLRARAGLAGTVFLADGRPWHEAGAGEAQELAAVLATGVAYLRTQEALGIALGEARRHVGLSLAADADVFLGLAKFRAMRRLWARVEAASGLEPEPVRLHAETSWRMMTRFDPWTNVMRATAATFAVALGGADTITVLPFTLPLGLPDEGARRLARNLQRVLLDEANLARVVDPAAGSGGFEALTEGLCRDAWALFQAIEREGGIGRAAASDQLKARIVETAMTRARDVATLSHGIIGTSRFASLGAPRVDVLGVAPHPAPAAGSGALSASRDAEPWEVLRDRAARLADRGVSPGVFLATLGAPAAYGPRATYAANFFGAAGITAEVGFETRDIDALVAAFRQSGACVVCVCGSDAAYVEDAAPLARALRAAGARRISAVGSLAANDREMPPDVDICLFDRCDALQILRDMLDVMSESEPA